jgi:succinyl-diaminopimelate desuccinylase
MSTTLELTELLIAKASVTPNDEQCQGVIAKRLESLGFECTHLPSAPEGAPDLEVQNLWAIKRPAPHPTSPGLPDSPGHEAPVLVFAGHTDVVPTGPLKSWSSDPFAPSKREGKLYGRGASDMKSSLAAMVVACEEFYAQEPHPSFSVAFLLTSDEEGPATHGTVAVCRWLTQQRQRLDWCIVGEPTSVKVCGDMIKNGRRGTLSGKLVVKGLQGHIAYPHLAKNPIHLMAPALNELVAMEWDQGNEFFQPTSWQVSNIHAGTGASNVIPGECVIDFNFRFCTESTIESLQQRLQSVLDHHSLEYSLQWTLGGQPFITPPAALVEVVQSSIESVIHQRAELSTTGGTSDGRFIATICPEVIELGPPNASIHKVDEHIEIADIDRLKDIYLGVLQRLNDLAARSESHPHFAS